jgi:cardiolipin synthase
MNSEFLIEQLMGWQWLQLCPQGLAALAGTVALVGSAHVILSKREVGAAAAWVGLIWLGPVLGIVLYLLLGINLPLVGDLQFVPGEDAL